MSTPEVRLPTWATDEIISVGPDTGYPVKEEPAEATKQQGYIGGEPAPAYHDNWLQNAQCQWLGYLAPIAIQNLRREASGIVIGTEPVGQVVIEPMPCHYKGVWVIPGSKAPGSDNDGIVMSWPGSFNYELAFEQASLSQNCYVIAYEAQTVISAATDGTDCVLGITPNSSATALRVYRSADGAAPAPVVVSATPYNEAKVFCANDTFILLPHYAGNWVNGNKYHTSTDGGATWTERTIADAASALTVLFAATGPAGFALCWSDSDKIGFSADGVSFSYTSMGGGRRPTGITLIGSVAYVLCASGELMRVPLGGVATVVSTIDEAVSFSDLAVPGGSSTFFGSLLASDGVRAMIALGHDRKLGTCYYSSLDSGATWVKTRLTSAMPMRSADLTDGGGRPLCVSYASGEFLALTYSWPLGSGLDCTRIEIWRSPKL